VILQLSKSKRNKYGIFVKGSISLKSSITFPARIRACKLGSFSKFIKDGAGK